MTFKNEPLLDFSDEKTRVLMKEELEVVHQSPPKTYPLLIGGRESFSLHGLTSINPSNPSEVIGEVSKAEKSHVGNAVHAAREAFRSWRLVPPQERAEYLFNVAKQMREKRFFLASLIIREAGKSWVEADADVCEAIDFLEFYGREMIRLGKPSVTQDFPGETNESIYIPRGVAAVIAPWNFPLAILTGMTSAAVVAGNTVVMKPASQTPIIGRHLVNMFRNAGLPAGILNYIAGPGDEIGEYLINHPDVDLIAFTGSKEAGLRIIKLASEFHPDQQTIKRVVAELGGKNAIIVDKSADVDQAVNGIYSSAFGYSGQKCSAASRVIVLEEVYDEVVKKLVEKTRIVPMGRAEHPETVIGPLISREQLEKVKKYIEIGKTEAETALEMEAPDLNGFFVGPVIFRDVPPDARIAREEIFGPVVSAIKAADFDDALRIANSTEYALTAGLYSRNRTIIDRFKREVDAGNRYINRKITGAIVERQPFGGYKLSGIGSKAGGRDYLTQFMVPVSITEKIS